MLDLLVFPITWNLICRYLCKVHCWAGNNNASSSEEHHHHNWQVSGHAETQAS